MNLGSVETPVYRQLEGWKKKLIDFSKRNQLLYFKPRPSLSIELNEKSEDIFRKLVLESKSLRFRENITALNTSDFDEVEANGSIGYDADPDDLPPGVDALAPADEFADSMLINEYSEVDFENSLQTDKDEKTLIQTLSKLRTRARASLNEQGVNILYLALNFIKWVDRFSVQKNSRFESSADSSEEDDDLIDNEGKSPLILIPVSLERKGLNAPYQLNIIDDEIRFNPTLAYKLHRDYGIDLTKLEEKLESIDSVETLAEFMDKVKDLIKDYKDWELLDESSISLFSFTKLSLYKDLEDHEELIVNHPILKQIAGEHPEGVSINSKNFEMLGEENSCIVNAKDLDKRVDANKAFQILDADSSQQEAIYAARAGQSFVLQGPPGTGKSQTIANIISESLAQNKKVLFVSEKKAALDVVVNRLKLSNLDKFCFELHGSKQKKIDIISSLNASLEEIKSLAVESIRTPYIDDINGLKEKIQLGIDELHKIRQPINKSLYEIYGELSRLNLELAESEDINFTISSIERLKEKDLSELDYFFDQLESKSEILNDYPNFIWRNASPNQLSFELENEIKSNFLEFQRILKKVRDFANPISQRYFNKELKTISEFKWMHDACKLALESPFPKREWFNRTNLNEVTQLTTKAKIEHTELSKRKDSILSKYSDSFLNLDHENLLTKFTHEYKGVFRFLNVGYWKNMAKVKKTALYNEVKGLHNIINDLEEAVKLDKQSAELKDSEIELSLGLGDFYKNFDTNWEETLNAIKWVQKILNKFETDARHELDINPNSSAAAIPAAFINVISSESRESDDFLDFEKQSKNLIQAYELLKFHMDFYRSIFSVTNVDIEKLTIEELHEHLQDLIRDMIKIEDWIEFKGLRDKAQELGLKQFVDALLNNPSANNSSDLKRRFLRKFYQLWVDKLEIESVAMRRFSGQEQQLLINKFNDLDLKQMTKVNKELAKKLALNWIEYASNPLSQEALQLLNSELNKKKRHKPIRLLIKEIPELLMTLKPCWMMSPLSVSQLVDTDASRFDIIIFDEASQIRTEDAICSIYRGKQLILAGDTQQLPPTDFFSYTEDKEDDYDNHHYESVLDECAVFLPNRTLNWHYRSRHESLISFSNLHIYDSKLVTFPAPILYSDSYGVHFEYVSDGRYEKGSRFNRKEAKRTAEAVIEHYTQYPDQSLGVIAFSEAQQLAIERELSKLLRKNHELDKFFDEDNQDAFFIKNLENVQGDERDVIYFSIGYAREKRGASLSHNFGPLNREGGHRRLNVAVTRARNKIKVFSSISGADIDPSRTSAQGAMLLKKYLTYAQEEQLARDKVLGLPEELNISEDSEALAEDVNADIAQDIQDLKKDIISQEYKLTEIDQQKFMTGLEESIAISLEEQGYKVQRLVGSSSYKIDLAVYDKDDESKFLLAIETDGLIYRSALTTRDRERLRKQVLDNLGWKVHRVYARDWIRNQAYEFEKLMAQLQSQADSLEA